MQGQGQNLLFDFDDFVRITNHLPETIEARYDNRDYIWEAALPDSDPSTHDFKDVHKMVAQHVFGWVDPKVAPNLTQKDIIEIRERAMLRLGWIQPSNDPNTTPKAALKKLQQITIGPLPPLQNVRLLRARDSQGNEDPNRAPVLDVLPAEEPGLSVAPGVQVGSGEAASKPLLPEDPLANAYQPPKRVEQVKAKGGK